MTDLARQGNAPLLDIDGAVATLRLCRPLQANRIEPGDVEVLRTHFRSLRDRHAEVRALLIIAEGKHFSSGFHLGAIVSALEAGASFREAGESDAFADMVDMLEELPQTTVCAINGGVFGGSTDLALACDFRIGEPGSRMRMPAARFGLHYYATGLRRYVTRLGLNAAKRLFLMAEELDANSLLEIGFLTAVVPAERLQEEASAIARRASTMAPLACAGMKSAMNAMAAGNYDVVKGEQIYQACMESADLREGIAAALAKREPRFQRR